MPFPIALRSDRPPSPPPAPVVLRERHGDAIPLEVRRWRASADEVERRLVATLPDCVIDVGCGPGRMVEAVAATGRRALGIDPSPHAAAEAAGRGVAVLQRSVFDALPGEGRWGAAMLLDGNVGIGGDPEALMRRVGQLLRPGGVALVEVEPPGAPTTTVEVRLERSLPDGSDLAPAGPWFPWARVGADGVGATLAAAGLALRSLTESGGRWWAHGARP